ncbi:hypothetical protein HUJ05_002091 [Dendroctonus ponderosae]|nr:hypothetical protein HUJ05_002091 [Dendroctonus ponderosae]
MRRLDPLIGDLEQAEGNLQSFVMTPLLCQQYYQIVTLMPFKCNDSSVRWEDWLLVSGQGDRVHGRRSLAAVRYIEEMLAINVVPYIDFIGDEFTFMHDNARPHIARIVQDYIAEVGMYEPGVAQHHLCNVQIGDWNCVNRSRIRITAILIAIFAVTVVSKVLLLMCVMTWCYKHFRQSGKACVKDLNPESTSIVLCEELEAFEKCLCCETDENHENPRKSKTLHSQTVNVSYFPCSPSVFSSMRTSTDSTKYSIKSGPSRDLSNTSSSAVISFPDGQSSQDSDSNEILFCEDETSNDIAYGVYCGVNPELNELGTELEEEDQFVKDNKSDDIVNG